MEAAKIKVNRAPVMTLWAAVVAEYLGYSPDEALTLAKAVAGLNAQAKGQRLGIYEPGAEQPEAGEKDRRPERRAPGETYQVDLLGRPVPVVSTEDGLRAISKEKPVEPRSVQRYLERKFGDDLPRVRQAMEALAGRYSPAALEGRAYSLYEKFRPKIPEGVKGWGAEGELDLELIQSLGSSKE